MTRLLTARNLHDGTRWRGPGWLRVENGRVAEAGLGPAPEADGATGHPCLMPALIDAHCHVSGYLEHPRAEEPYAPHRAYLALLREAGVGAVRDLGNHAETAESLQTLPDAPLIRHAGPVIDEPPGRVPHSRLVVDEAGARAAVGRAAAEGASWVKTYSALRPELVAAVVQEAAQHGLGVAHRPGRTDALTAVQLGVGSLEHLPLCLPAGDLPSGATPLTSPTTADQVLRWWADPGRRRHLRRLTVALAEAGVAVSPLLLAWRRAAVLEEAVAEPRLHRLVPITPHHRYLEQMRGPGLAFGRKYARRYLGYQQLKGTARTELETGWRTLLDTLGELHATGVRLLPGSDAPGVSLVPGYALHDELTIWESAGLDRHTVLAAAIGGNAAALDIPQWSAGVVALPADPAGAPTLAAALAGAELVVPPVRSESVVVR